MATYTVDKVTYNGNTYNLQDAGALQKTGGTVTGPVTFDDTITTNDIQTSTINNVEVGDSPKFTDTVTTATTTGDGNAITSITASNGALNVQKSTTFIHAAGTGLSKSGSTLNHSNSITAGTIGTSSNTSGVTIAVPYATYDAQGHITNKGTHTHTITTATASANGVGRVAGGTNVSVSYSSGVATVNAPSNVSAFTNDAGYITEADIPEGAAAYTGTPSAVSTTAAKGESNGFARGDHVHNITGTTITDALGYTPYNSTNPNGYTSNVGTVTGVKINGTTKNPTSGVVDIGTVLTSYTETDPVYSASAAAGITSSDITNWNNKTSNTGTVTGVTAGTGLKVGTNTSGGTISTSGTINHINSVTAKTTQGLYPITYDAQGHITGSGNAVAIPTASSTTPLMDGTASIGSGTTWAKADHVHPSDSSKVDVSSSGSLTSDINLVANISNEDGTVDIYSEPESGSTGSKTGITIGGEFTRLYNGDNNYLDATPSGFMTSYVSPSGQQLTSNVGPTTSGMAVFGQSETDSWASFDLGFNNNTDEAQATLSVRGAVSSGPFQENEIIVTPTTTTIKNVVTPVDNGDAVPKSYVDNAISAMPRSTWFGTSNTAASTVIKVVTCEGFTLTEGAMISIRFLTANTTAAPVLNVNSTGDTSIFVGASPVSSTNTLMWSADTVLTFVYSGVNFYYISAAAPATYNHPDGAGSWYGTSSTAATTAAKVSSITNYRLTPGTRVSIVFSDANTYVDGALTLNVNSTGAKNIFVNNAVTSASNTLTWDAGECLTFVYSGRYYYFVERSKQALSTAVASSDNTIYYPVLGNATTSAETKYYDTGLSYRHDLSSSGDLNYDYNGLQIGDQNTDRAAIVFKGSNGYVQLSFDDASNNGNVIDIPNASGTLALTSNIPAPGTTASTISSTSSSGGTATSYSKSDHVHSISGTTITNALGYTPSPTDNKVAQNNSTAPNDFRVLLSNSVSDSSETAEANKSAGLRFMPSTNHLYVGSAGQDALITVSPRLRLGAFNRYDEDGSTESEISYGVGIGIDNALAYTSYFTTTGLLFQHWNATRPSGGTPSSTNYVASAGSITHAHVLLRDYSGKGDLETQSELTSARLSFINSAGTYIVTPTKINKWDDHTENGNYNLTAATTQAVYPIKIDNRGHISAHGSAVTIPTASTATPAMDGTASYGSGTVYARSNHVHPTDTSRAAKGNFVSFTVSNTTTTKSLTSGHIYLLVTKCMNNSAAGGLYIVAPHNTTGSVTEVKAGTGTTVSISKTTLTVKTTVNNIHCRLVDLNMPN